MATSRNFGLFGGIVGGDNCGAIVGELMAGTVSNCWFDGELTVMGLGSGKIYLKGSPTTKNRTLGIKVIPVQ